MLHDYGINLAYTKAFESERYGYTRSMHRMHWRTVPPRRDEIRPLFYFVNNFSSCVNHRESRVYMILQVQAWKGDMIKIRVSIGTVRSITS